MKLQDLKKNTKKKFSYKELADLLEQQKLKDKEQFQKLFDNFFHYKIGFKYVDDFTKELNKEFGK